MTSPIVINMTTRELLAGETKNSLFNVLNIYITKTIFVNKYLFYREQRTISSYMYYCKITMLIIEKKRSE